MVVVVQRLYILYKSYQEEQKKVVFKMVEDIVDLLSQQALTNPGDNFLLINHIRDQLIAPSERESMYCICLNVSPKATLFQPR